MSLEVKSKVYSRIAHNPTGINPVVLQSFATTAHWCYCSLANSPFVPQPNGTTAIYYYSPLVLTAHWQTAHLYHSPMVQQPFTTTAHWCYCSLANSPFVSQPNGTAAFYYYSPLVLQLTGKQPICTTAQSAVIFTTTCRTNGL
ncbi:hypothetical protein HOLleu_28286 [Holothuria leucospilota]|uniref:Uncharacterized protein n=1 Tax=Holothuria leucospilota TaxID=206669 RepID=A0A9Q1H095_HOLLE|nr:hypothetical protein HOLleu_28286 [Holothuria leucospilota]